MWRTRPSRSVAAGRRGGGHVEAPRPSYRSRAPGGAREVHPERPRAARVPGALSSLEYHGTGDPRPGGVEALWTVTAPLECLCKGSAPASHMPISPLRGPKLEVGDRGHGQVELGAPDAPAAETCSAGRSSFSRS